MVNSEFLKNMAAPFETNQPIRKLLFGMIGGKQTNKLVFF